MSKVAGQAQLLPGARTRTVRRAKRKPAPSNLLYTGDNLYILHGMDSKSVDLIYLDPPFNSKRLYEAPVGSKAAGASFKDMWTWQDVDESYLDKLVEWHPQLVQFIQSAGAIHGAPMMAYLTYLTQRLIEMRRVLKPTGSLYLHCDPTASHYLKIIMDQIFGKDNFRNEIVWDYTFRLMDLPRFFNRKHDLILFYAASKETHFSMPKTPWTRDEIVRTRKQKIHVDEQGHEVIWMPGGRGHSKSRLKKLSEIMAQGKAMSDVWPIPVISSSAKERTGYPTQKPLALLERIIRASSREGDVVLDPFCGCATTCVAAQHLQRQWIGIDISEKAAELVAERLSDEGRLFTDFVHLDRPPVRTDLKRCAPSLSTKGRLFKDQGGKCNACGEAFDARHMEIDHIIPRAKNGGDHYENYQLLCGHCNRTKGDRPMEYLQAKIKRRTEALRASVDFLGGKAT